MAAAAAEVVVMGVLGMCGNGMRAAGLSLDPGRLGLVRPSLSLSVL
jgi:hypothetical protein